MEDIEFGEKDFPEEMENHDKTTENNEENKNVSKEDKRIVELAIDKREEFKYTDIELLFLEGSKYVRFGPDYNFSIEDNTLICEYDYEGYRKLVERNKERKEQLKKVLENYKKNKKEN